VKGQSAAFLEKSRELLDDADAILSVNRYEAAARAAYMAGFHAAQALIFESSGRIYKTHAGVQSEFSRLVKDDARVDDQIRAFLGRAYNLKAIADYQTGPRFLHLGRERPRGHRHCAAVCRMSHPSYAGTAGRPKLSRTPRPPAADARGRSRIRTRSPARRRP
jgi:uncharacterized protein (UPF0332 family)